MSSTAVDSHLPPVDVPLHSSQSVDDQKLEESIDHNNNNNNEKKKIEEGEDPNQNIAAIVNETSVKLTKIDLLGFGDDKAVAGGKPSDVVEISDDLSEVDENQCEVFNNFPPNISILNVNGGLRFELVTVRENGRLQMYMVPYTCPQMVKSHMRNGRLRIWLRNDEREQLSPPDQVCEDDCR